MQSHSYFHVRINIDLIKLTDSPLTKLSVLMMDHTSLIPNVESNNEIITVFPEIRFSIAIWFATYDYSMSSDPTISVQRQRPIVNG